MCAQYAFPPPMEQLIARELFPRLDALIGQRVRELRRQRDFLTGELQHDEAQGARAPAVSVGQQLASRLSGGPASSCGALPGP